MIQLTDGVVTLMPPRVEDAEAIAATVQASLDTLMPWMFWATPDYGAESAREWITHGQDPDAHGFTIRLADGTHVGGCGLQHHDAPNHCIELGYWVGSAHAGHGYATRAARLLVAHTFETLGIHRVTILVSVHNERSQRVAERVAGPPEAILRDRLRVRNQWHDACVYRVLAETS